MAVYFGKIDTYFVNILSPKAYAGRRIINLHGAFGKAILLFLPQNDPLPENRKYASQNVFDIYYHIDEWAAILDVLRNETPVYFNYDDTNNAAQIYTSREPVGEEES